MRWVVPITVNSRILNLGQEVPNIFNNVKFLHILEIDSQLLLWNTGVLHTPIGEVYSKNFMDLSIFLKSLARFCHYLFESGNIFRNLTTFS